MVNWLASRAILWLLAASLSLAAQFGAVEGGQDANDSMWTLTGYDFNQSSFTIQPYVSNGYIGQRLPVTGFGYSEIQPLGPQNGTNGWPLFDVRFTAAMVAGFYDQQPNTTGTNFDQTGGQQPISTIPTWSSLYLTVNGTTLQPDVNPDQISNWNQSMSIQHGVVQTAYEWMPSGATGPLSVKYTSFAHRTRPNLGVIRLDISGGHLQGVSVTDVLDGQGAHRVIAKGSGALANHSNTIYSSVSPIGIDNVTCVEMSSLRFVHGEGNLTSSSEACYLPPPDATTASQCYSVSPEGGSVSIVKYVGIASSDAFPESESQTAEFTIQTAIDTGYTALLEEHKRAWADLWDSADIVIPGEEQKQLQLAVRASFFHLLSNVRQGSEPKGLGDNSIAPAGLTSDSYAGQIFWDADTWMSYPLIAMFPEYALSILNYRYRFLPAAEQNARDFNVSGALYPWTGARFGNSTGVGPAYDYEYHLNSDIALAHIDYFYTIQNVTWLKERGYPVISAVADMWPTLVMKNASTQAYDVENVTSVDEYANQVDTSAFTNAGVGVILDDTARLAKEYLGLDHPSNWSMIADKMDILTASSGVTLEYDGFNGTTDVKQADVVLMTWPLEFNLSRENGLLNFAYYAGATSPNGPGMTYSVFSIGLEELSPPGCAGYTYMLAASQPYSRSPFYQFSEQTSDVYNDNGGTNPAFTFLTGHGGFLQSFTHGFSGFRPRLHAFYLNPSLPPQLPEVLLKGMHWKDSLFNVYMKRNATVITRTHGHEAKAAVEIGGDRNPKKGTYYLDVGESLQVPTSVSNQPLLDGNVAQCQSIYNATDSDFMSDGRDDVVAVRYSLAAIDGNNATSWQPSSNETASMILQLSQSQTVNHVHLNFGERPPRSYSLSAGDNPEDLQTLLKETQIDISAPYGSFDAAEVAVRLGNTTDASFQETTARYFQLSITGCQEVTDGVGATVAEWSLSKRG